MPLSVNKEKNQLRVFQPGEPACPVACKYCSITEHDLRRETWNTGSAAGVNNSCTFVNVPPWIGTDPAAQESFRSFPWHLLRGDYVGFTAITDPLWPEIEPWFWEFVERAGPQAKLLTAVTKWPVTASTMRKLARVPNFFLVVSITGNAPPIERFPVERHLRTLALAREHGVRALPISHPYIAGVSDLSFLPELSRMGYREFDVKGLRYCDRTMASWMPDNSRRYYVGREDEEVLPEDGWRDRVLDAGLSLFSPRAWYQREAPPTPSLDPISARLSVEELLNFAQVVTSSHSSAVKDAAIRRRL